MQSSQKGIPLTLVYDIIIYKTSSQATRHNKSVNIISYLRKIQKPDKHSNTHPVILHRITLIFIIWGCCNNTASPRTLYRLHYFTARAPIGISNYLSVCNKAHVHHQILQLLCVLNKLLNLSCLFLSDFSVLAKRSK